MAFEGSLADCMRWLSGQPDGIFEVKRKRKRRSDTQNAYYYAMENRLARKLGMPSSEVHFNMLREYGVAEVISVRSDVPISGYFKYWDQIGIGYANGHEFKHIRVYKRSRDMDSAEFSMLIDGMRQECEAQGIPFMTPSEIARMRFVEPKEA